MKVCWGANGRPAGRHAKMSRFCVTLPWINGVVVGLVAVTRGITVSRHAEFIFDVLFARGRHQIPQPEHTPVSRCVTLKCHARMSRWVTPLSRWVTAGRHAKMSRFSVTLTESHVWGGQMGGRMVFSGVSRHAEFIFDVRFARGRH